MNTKRERIYYIDRIKVLLCVLVIAMHTSVAYGGAGSWYYNEKTDSAVLMLIFTMFNAICQSFFMGLFFFISAYFNPASYKKKGAINFLKDKFIRLGIPLVVFYFILNPTINYIVYTISNEGGISYYSFLYKSIIKLQNIGAGPLWFVQSLLIF